MEVPEKCRMILQSIDKVRIQMQKETLSQRNPISVDASPYSKATKPYLNELRGIKYFKKILTVSAGVSFSRMCLDVAFGPMKFRRTLPQQPLTNANLIPCQLHSRGIKIAACLAVRFFVVECCIGGKQVKRHSLQEHLKTNQEIQMCAKGALKLDLAV